jgi:hypothetical protein
VLNKLIIFLFQEDFMATSPVKLQQSYGIGNAFQNLSPFSIIANRVPSQQDKARIGTFWIYTGANNVYVLSSVTGGLSNWLTLSNGGAGVFTSLTVNGPTQLNGSLTQVAGAVSLGADATGNAISIGTGAALKTINIGSQFAGSSVSAFAPFVINSPFAANSTLALNCWNAAGTYGQQTLATVAGGVFDACRWLNQSVAAGSGCQVSIWVDTQGVAGGDAALRFINNGVNGTLIGLDTSANQFSMSMGNLGDGNTFYTYDVATSQINMPKQISVFAIAGAQATVTGDGTGYNVQFANVISQIGTAFTGATGVFLCPIAGRYLFQSEVRLNSVSAAMTSGVYILYKNGAPYAGSDTKNPAACRSIAGFADFVSFRCGAIIDLVFNDQVTCNVGVFGGALACNIAAGNETFFSAQLLS